MATFTLAPNVKRQLFDDSGLPLDGGLLYTYLAGTTTEATTYQTSSGTAHDNPIELNSVGRVPGSSEIYLTPGVSYKFILKTAAGVELWSQDNIPAVPASTVNVDIAGTAGEDLTAGQIAYIGTGGAWFKADADAAASSVDPVLGFVVTTVASGASGTFRTDGQIELAGPLTPATKYYVSSTAGDITSTVPNNARLVGQAQSTTILAIALNPPSGSQVNILEIEVFT